VPREQQGRLEKLVREEQLERRVIVETMVLPGLLDQLVQQDLEVNLANQDPLESEEKVERQETLVVLDYKDLKDLKGNEAQLDLQGLLVVLA